MIANVAVMTLLARENKQNGWGPDDWDGGAVLFTAFVLILAVGLVSAWVFA